MFGKKPILVILAFFSILVFFDWLFSGARALLAPRGGSGLAEINFAFFSNKDLRNYITQGYGATSFSLFNYAGRWHNGIDIAAQYGARVLSISDGGVIATGNQDDFCYKRGFGKFVAVIANKANLVFFYAHLGSIATSAGSRIKKGDMLGSVGNTGFETGPHLHLSLFDAANFQMKNKNGCGPDPVGKDFDPMKYVKAL